jgi:sulfite reductase (ferredoxin)
VKQADLATVMQPIVAAFATGRQDGEGFGDFCNRIGRDALLALPAA